MFKKLPWKLISIILLTILASQLLYIIVNGWFDRCPRTHNSHDFVVVFGNKVYPNGNLSPVLKSRVDEAFRVSKNKYCNRSGYILVSGGLGKEGVYEATAMGEYLKKLGHDPEKIIVDNYGNNSYLTAIHAWEFARTNNFNSILAVTSYYHITRAEQALRIAGFSKVQGQGSRYIAFQDIIKIPRELAGIYVYFVKYGLLK